MSEQSGFNMDWMNNEQNTIDLTGDRHAHNNPPQMRLALPSAPGGASAGASGPSSRTQRGPRFDRNIINLDNSDEEDHTERQMQHHTRENPIPGQSAAPAEESLFIPDTSNEHSLFTASTQRRPTTSGLRPGYMRHYPTAAGLDEVQVVATRSLSRHPSQRSTPTLPRPDETANDAGSTTIDLTADDDDDDVIHTSTRTLPGINGDHPAMAGSGIGTRERPTFGLAHLAQAMRAQGASPTVLDRFQGLGTANRDDPVARARAHQRHTRDVAIEARQRRENIELAHGIHGLRVPSRLGLAARLERRTPEAPGAAQPAHRRRPGQARMFIDLDFGMAAFDMGYGEPARPATPKYEAPPPAEKGFTRSPEEDEEVVCPNCGDELAVSEDETKSQVWVIKACGHVSCSCVDVFKARFIKLTHSLRLTAVSVLPAVRRPPAKRAKAEPLIPASRRQSRSVSWWAARRASASNGFTST